MGERTRILEGTWDCTECSTTAIAGRLKRCPTCGAPREGTEAEFDFSANQSVIEPEGLDLATAGLDWYCFYCNAANRGDGERCGTCGAQRRELAGPSEPEEEEAPEPAPSSSGRKFVGVLLVLLIVGGGFALWASRTTMIRGEVTGVSWERQLVHEAFTRLDAQGWRTDLKIRKPVMPTLGEGDVPGLFEVRDCDHRERSPRSCEEKTRQTRCGVEEKCTVKDLGNGFAEETCRDVQKYCPEPYEECTEAVWDDWCTYSTHEWKHLNTAKTHDTTTTPAWPPPIEAGPLERVRKEESYEVRVRYGEEVHTFEPPDAASFSKWSVGSGVLVEVNNLGMVSAVERPR